jgi:ribonucleotide monophosphatase NagD (HAD superfamily)
MGKPDRTMIDTVVAELGTSLENVIMVGDRLETDVRMAVNAGMNSAMVLTGDSQLSDLETCATEFHPTFVLERIDLLIPQASTGAG